MPSSTRPWSATGLDTIFGVVVSSDEVAHGKPEPDVYLEAARRLGVAPATCLVVEDSYNGVLAARAAGMTVVLVPNKSIPPAAGTEALADLVLESLADLRPGDVARGRPDAASARPAASIRSGGRSATGSRGSSWRC